MRTNLIALFALCLALPCAANPLLQLAQRVPAASSNITVDLWQTFEFDAPADAAAWATALAANDNCATGTWNVTATNTALSISTSGERATISTVNTAADSGTRGFAYDNTSGLAHYARYVPASTQANVSFGFWFQTPTFGASSFSYVYMLRIYGSSATTFNSSYRNNGATNVIRFSNANGTSGDVTVSNATWYWVSCDYVRNGTGSLAVFDTSGAQVGSTVTLAIPDQSASEFFWGALDGSSSVVTTTYFDDLVIDWTDHTFPLGP